MKTALAALYEGFRLGGASHLLGEIGPALASPPLLVDPFPEYEQAPLRIAYVGQATGGWTWHSGYKEYEEWTMPAIDTLDDFVARESAVADLMAGYRMFGHCGRQRLTPFWRFHRKVLSGIELSPNSAVWTNVLRVDVAGRNPSGPTADSVVRHQQGLLRAEFSILKPETAIFTTSWTLDGLVEHELGPIDWKPVGDFDPRMLRQFRVQVTGLRGFRTYHPQYLTRIRQFDRVAGAIVEHLRSST